MSRTLEPSSLFCMLRPCVPTSSGLWATPWLWHRQATRGLLSPGLATRSLSWLVWLFTAHDPGGIGLPASQRPSGLCPPQEPHLSFTPSTDCFLALELGHSGTKGVDAFLLPCSFHRDLQEYSHSLSNLTDPTAGLGHGRGGHMLNMAL